MRDYNNELSATAMIIPRILVGGDRYVAAFRFPAHSFQPKVKGNPSERWSFVCVGADVVLATIDGLRRKGTAKPSLLKQKEKRFLSPSVPLDVWALGEFPRKVGSEGLVVRADDKSYSTLECQREISVPAAGGGSPPREPTKSDIVIHWIAPRLQLPIKKRCRVSDPCRCGVHIQVGRYDSSVSKARGSSRFTSMKLANPSVARVVVTCLEEICPDERVRKALSYDSIVVDLLRALRGTTEEYAPTPLLLSLGGIPKNAVPPTVPLFIVVRINNAATLLYSLGISQAEATDEATEEQGEENSKVKELAKLFFHPDRPAPVATPGLGRMLGYNSLIAASLAVGIDQSGRDENRDLCSAARLYNVIESGICESIVRESLLFDKGFAEVIGKYPVKGCIPLKRISKFVGETLLPPDEKETKAVSRCGIEIGPAVSPYRQWFVPSRETKDAKREEEPQSKNLELAIKWLTGASSPEDDDISIIKLGKLQLTDRREVESFLSVRAALLHYSDRRNYDNSMRPLSIGVFGPPGDGKSFGIKQIVEDLKPLKLFAKDILEFNLSQFSSLEDYAAAFHMVRDLCLGDKPPIVFFDEFDCDFDGKPLGWLKYFLAPMQDATFIARGATFQIGRCVLVFAGGVNRSFSDFGGRIRNISFIQAKGPDFMSRLRCHLDIRGINKPEPRDEAVDLDRYIIRRALILRSQLLQRLKWPKNNEAPQDGLLHPDVARAFLTVEEFRHGARSMEAILDMCDSKRGSPIGPSELPARDQLNMHVDADKFLSFVL